MYLYLLTHYSCTSSLPAYLFSPDRVHAFRSPLSNSPASGCSCCPWDNYSDCSRHSRLPVQTQQNNNRSVGSFSSSVSHILINHPINRKATKLPLTDTICRTPVVIAPNGCCTHDCSLLAISSRVIWHRLSTAVRVHGSTVGIRSLWYLLGNTLLLRVVRTDCSVLLGLLLLVVVTTGEQMDS